MTIKHLVTSGCSFSDNHGMRWPHYLAESMGAQLYNRGQGSSGNHWIAKSSIYQTQLLLDSGISPEEILVVVMWSGIDRKDCFIDAQGTVNYSKLINDPTGHPNPVNFLDNDPNVRNKHCLIDSDGYLSGSAVCTFSNENILKFKKDLILKYFSPQALAIESYENFLRLHWFCKSVGVKLVNQTFMDIMHYPSLPIMTKDHFRNIKPLFNMLDFKNWIFWNNTQGIYEYCKDNNLSYYEDNVHPSEQSHKHYVDNFLFSKVKELLV